MTLIEVMIATMILAFALASVLAVASHCYRYMTDLRRTARSSQMMQQQLEDIRLLTWSQVQALSSTFSNSAFPEFRGTITQSPYDIYSGSTNVMTLTLSTIWTNQTHRVLTNRMTTLVANGGLNKYFF